MTSALTRVARDAAGPRSRYEDFEIGADLGSLDWVVEPANVEGLLANDAEAHEWYVDTSPFGGAIVPPMAIYPPVRILFTRRYNVRGLFYWFEATFHRPIIFGETVVITGRIVDKWIKRDREYVKYEAEGTAADGEVIFQTRRTHVLDYIKRSAPRDGEI